MLSALDAVHFHDMLPARPAIKNQSTTKSFRIGVESITVGFSYESVTEHLVPSSSHRLCLRGLLLHGVYGIDIY